MCEEEITMSFRCIILGAGISGLSCAWFLKQKFGSRLSLLVLEKTERAGGWVCTKKQEGFLFEQGPRSCRSKGHGIETLRLVEELGLQEEVIIGSPSACFRYLYLDQQLQRLPHHFISLFLSPLTRRAIPSLLKEWKQASSSQADESVYDFFNRRLGPYIAETFIDPFVSGIYAGDTRQLSMQSCFPSFYALEKEKGSLTKGLLMRRASKTSISPFIQHVQRSPLFTFKKGMQTLTDTLANRLEENLRFHCQVVGLKQEGKKMHIALSNGEELQADWVISTLPSLDLGGLLPIKSIPHATLAVVNVGYRRSVLKEKGFGYLIPSKEKEDILGCVWDSSAFPQQNHHPEETRLTLMMGGMHHPHLDLLPKEACIQKALEALSKHLGIEALPDSLAFKWAKNCIPQYPVGYQEEKEALRRLLAVQWPQLTLLGNGFTGVALNDCIAQARQWAQRFEV
jgi:protoporphyrinogen/coproporphyrinogen III oxidase